MLGEVGYDVYTRNRLNVKISWKTVCCIVYFIIFYLKIYRKQTQRIRYTKHQTTVECLLFQLSACCTYVCLCSGDRWFMSTLKLPTTRPGVCVNVLSWPGESEWIPGILSSKRWSVKQAHNVQSIGQAWVIGKLLLNMWNLWNAI